MKNSDYVSNMIKEASALSNKKLARDIRVSVLTSMIKTAEEGYFDSPTGSPAKFETRENYIAQRGGTFDPKVEYGVGLPKHPKSDLTTDTFSRSLSTRYSPDRVGVQAKRISDGVFQDPITNKIYDWNEGFKTEDGDVFSGGGVSLQTDIMYRE